MNRFSTPIWTVLPGLVLFAVALWVVVRVDTVVLRKNNMFTEEQRGQTVSFAAAMPYGYSDMLKDLREARHFLMQDECAHFRYDEGKSQLIKKFIPKVNFGDSNGANN